MSTRREVILSWLREKRQTWRLSLDFGRNFANDQSLFYFNMTEAF